MRLQSRMESSRTLLRRVYSLGTVGVSFVNVINECKLAYPNVDLFIQGLARLNIE